MHKRAPLLRPRKKQNVTSPSSNGTSSFKPVAPIRNKKNTKKSPIVWVIFLLVILATCVYVKNSDESKLISVGGSNSNTPNIPKTNKVASSTSHKAAPVKPSGSTAHEGEDASNNPNIHLIFSTDCSAFQHWQSYLMFHSALKVNQPGTITRIASGCSDDETKAEQKWHKEHISDVMGEQFKIHFTPHFSGVKDKNGNTVGNYKFFNKPFGLLHWLEHGNISDGDEDEDVLDHPDDIVILIDPDMILMKPITNDFSNKDDVIVGPRHRKEQKFFVEKGSPFAQKYGLGAQWRGFDLDKIAGPDSPAKDVSQQVGGTFYPAGPPYLATTSDMYQIALKWAEFAPLVHAQYPHLLAEMYAFCIAAAHLGLKHQLVDSLMISNVFGGGEGWPMVDKITADKVDSLCQYASQSDHSEFPVPSVIHYCQRYAIGDWFFGKKKMAKNFFECDSPLMEFPPLNIIETSNYKKIFNDVKKDLPEDRARREGFMVCGIIGALNDAALYFKENSCKDVESNLEKKTNLNKKNCC